MEQQTFNIGDFVSHKALTGISKIYVANATEDKILGRYAKEGIIYSIELFNHEVELYKDNTKRPSSYF